MQSDLLSGQYISRTRIDVSSIARASCGHVLNNTKDSLVLQLHISRLLWFLFLGEQQKSADVCKHSLIWHDEKLSTVWTGNVDRVHYITVVKMFFWNGVTRVQVYLGEHQEVSMCTSSLSSNFISPTHPCCQHLFVLFSLASTFTVCPNLRGYSFICTIMHFRNVGA